MFVHTAEQGFLAVTFPPPYGPSQPGQPPYGPLPYDQPPHGQHPPAQVPYQQPSPYQPHGARAYGLQHPATTHAGPEPSGITAITSAVLGLVVALTWTGGVVGLFMSMSSATPSDYLSAAGTAALLSVPTAVGALGVFARTKFGRVMLIVGLGLPVPLAALLVTAPGAFGGVVFVASAAGIVLTCLPTTGRYIRAAKRYTTPREQQSHPAAGLLMHPQQRTAQQMAPQPHQHPPVPASGTTTEALRPGGACPAARKDARSGAS